MKYNLKAKDFAHIAVAIVCAVLCFTLLSAHFSSLDTHATTLKIIDQQRDNVAKLLTASTSASAVISLIPDDTCTPIADRLADLSVFFMFALAFLYLEKFILPVIGLILFKWIIPAASLFWSVSIVYPSEQFQHWKPFIIKIVIFMFILFSIIPFGTHVSDAIDTIYHDPIQQSINAALSVEDAQADIAEEKGWFESIVDNVVGNVTGAFNWAKGILNNFVDATALVLVTSCLVPCLVCAAMLFLAKSLFHTNLFVPIRKNFYKATDYLHRSEHNKPHQLSA